MALMRELEAYGLVLKSPRTTSDGGSRATVNGEPVFNLSTYSMLVEPPEAVERDERPIVSTGLG